MPKTAKIQDKRFRRGGNALTAGGSKKSNRRTKRRSKRGARKTKKNGGGIGIGQALGFINKHDLKPFQYLKNWKKIGKAASKGDLI